MKYTHVGLEGHPTQRFVMIDLETEYDDSNPEHVDAHHVAFELPRKYLRQIREAKNAATQAQGQANGLQVQVTALAARVAALEAAAQNNGVS